MRSKSRLPLLAVVVGGLLVSALIGRNRISGRAAGQGEDSAGCGQPIGANAPQTVSSVGLNLSAGGTSSSGASCALSTNLADGASLCLIAANTSQVINSGDVTPEHYLSAVDALGQPISVPPQLGPYQQENLRIDIAGVVTSTLTHGYQGDTVAETLRIVGALEGSSHLFIFYVKGRILGLHALERAGAQWAFSADFPAIAVQEENVLAQAPQLSSEPDGSSIVSIVLFEGTRMRWRFIPGQPLVLL